MLNTDGVFFFTDSIGGQNGPAFQTSNATLSADGVWTLRSAAAFPKLKIIPTEQTTTITAFSSDFLFM